MPLNSDDRRGGLVRGGAPGAPPVAPPAKATSATARAPELPVVVSGAREPATAQDVPGGNKLPATPSGPPHPTLTKLGYWGTIGDFNGRVESVVNQYKAAYGTTPSPGLVLDLARSPVSAEHFPAMFAVPLTQAGAKAKGAITAHPPKSAGLIAGEMEQAAARGNLDQYLSDNADELQAFANDPASAGTIAKATAQARRVQTYTASVAQPKSAQADSARKLPGNDGNPANLIAPSDRDVYAHGMAWSLSHLLTTAAGQIVQGVVDSPAGLYTVGRAVALDTSDATAEAFSKLPGSSGYAREHGNASFSRTRNVAKQTAEGYVQDVEHPMANPGRLFLDTLGLLTTAGGAAARVSAAGRAVSEAGEIASPAAKVGAAAKALARKPEPPTATITKGDLSVDVLLSENPIVAAVQQKLLDRRQQGLTLRHETGEAVPIGAAGTVLKRNAEKIADGLSEQFSFETKLGRELRAQRRTEQAIRDAAAAPLIDAAGRDLTASRAYNRFVSALPAKARPGLTLGEQKAIQVAATDAEDPMAANVDFHQRMIEQGIGDPEAHKRQLATLKLAAKALANPSPRLVKALEAVRDVMAEQQRLKVEQFGLDAQVAESRIARHGAILRGEDVTEPAVLSNPELQTKLGDLRDRLAENLVAQEEFASKPRSAERAAGGPAKGRKPDATLARLRREESDLHDQIDELQGSTTLKTLDRVNPESFYLPAKPEGRSAAFAVANPDRGATVGPYGIAKPTDMPELTHVFTGDAIQAGDFRVDAAGLAAESYGKTVKALSILNSYRKLLEASTDKPRSRFDVPIREERGIPQRLKDLVAKIDAGAFTSEDAAGIPEDELNALIAHLYPSKDERQIDGVRWIDRRLIGDANRLPRKPGRVMKAYDTIVNTPLRAATLYARPAYALNLLGNAGMAVIQQGFAWPGNMLRALHAQELYGEKVTGMLDAMAGEGKSRSYAPDDAVTNKVAKAMGSFWNKATDQAMRRSAVLYELRRLGYRTPEEVKQVVLGSLHDDTLMQRVTQASRRAKKAMVELDNMTTFEQETLRHVIFVYPWVSRSAVWSLRTIAEHPVKTDVLVHLGNDADQNLPELKFLPKFMRESGYFPVGTDANGNPKIVNPGSINSFSTLGQAAGLLDGTDSVEDMLGPGASVVVHEITGKDRFGRAYTHRYLGPLTDQVSALPQYAAVLRATKKPAPLPGVDVTDTGTLVARENAAAKSPMYINEGVWSVIGPLLAGGLMPRTASQLSLDARYWAAQPADVRNRHDQELMQNVLTMQGALLGRNVPAKVRAAVRIADALTVQRQAFATKHGRTPTVKERTGMTIDYLAAHFLVSESEAASLRDQLAKTRDDGLSSFESMVTRKYADGKAYSDWHGDVKTVASFQPQLLDQVIQQGVARNVIDGSLRNTANADPKVLHELGRRYVAYQRAINEFQKRAAASKDATVVNAELRQFVDEQDKTVTIDGHTFPSLPRLAVAFMPPDQMNAHLSGLLDASWENLSGLDKQMLGFGQVKPKVAEAWAAYKHATAPASLAKQLPAGERSLDAFQRRAVAKQIDRFYNLGGSFLKDYDFAQQPLYSRLKHLAVVQHSPDKTDWLAVFDQANQLYRASRDGSITSTEATDAWHDYVPQLEQFIKTSRPKFWQELQPILKQSPDFLTHLLN